MKTQPIISILCTVYNHEPYLRECLEGFVMQKTDFAFEAIVHDDVSTDGSVAIICEYAKKYPHIIKPIIEKENQYSKHDGSLRKILNGSISPSSKYVAICEGDDYWTDPYKLQKQVGFLESHEDFGLVATVCKSLVQEEGRFYEAARQDEKELTFEDLLFDDGFATCTTVFRKQLYFDYNKEIKKQWLMGDYPRCLFIASQSRIYRMGCCTAVYRVIPESASHSTDLGKYLMFRLSGIDCSHYFIEKYGLSQSREKEFCKKTAYQLYRTGLSLQNNDFIAASIKYKKEHHVRVTIKDYFTDFIFRSRPICSLMNGLIKLYRIIKRSVFGFKVRG